MLFLDSHPAQSLAPSLAQILPLLALLVVVWALNRPDRARNQQVDREIEELRKLPPLQAARIMAQRMAEMRQDFARFEAQSIRQMAAASWVVGLAMVVVVVLALLPRQHPRHPLMVALDLLILVLGAVFLVLQFWIKRTSRPVDDPGEEDEQP